MDERTLIEQLVAGMPLQAEGLLCGIGDDCAVFSGDGRRNWLVSVDHCIEGVHFRPAWATWEQIGRKATLAAMSDVSAMGGRARFLVVALAIPRSMELGHVDGLYRGIRAVAQSAGMVIVGGDTAQSVAGLCSTLTVIGDVAHGRALLRRGARPGDAVYVTGTLGGAALGLQLLQQEGEAAHPAVQRQCEPPNRGTTGQWLASSGCVTAMIDISDGLVGDLRHIAQASRVGMRIDSLRVPCDPVLTGTTDTAVPEALRQLALTGGEDYELAFTVAGARAGIFHGLAAAASLTLGHPLTRIGEVVAGSGVVVLDATGQACAVPQPGFVHRFGEI